MSITVLVKTIIILIVARSTYSLLATYVCTENNSGISIYTYIYLYTPSPSRTSHHFYFIHSSIPQIFWIMPSHILLWQNWHFAGQKGQCLVILHTIIERELPHITYVRIYIIILCLIFQGAQGQKGQQGVPGSNGDIGDPVRNVPYIVWFMYTYI